MVRSPRAGPPRSGSNGVSLCLGLTQTKGPRLSATVTCALVDQSLAVGTYPVELVPVGARSIARSMGSESIHSSKAWLVVSSSGSEK